MLPLPVTKKFRYEDAIFKVKTNLNLLPARSALAVFEFLVLLRLHHSHFDQLEFSGILFPNYFLINKLLSAYAREVVR